MSVARSRSRRTGRILSVVLAGAVLIAALVAVALPAQTPRTPETVAEATLEAPVAIRPSRTQGLAIVRGWDQRRAAAWAAGDLGALRALYTRDAGAGMTDRTMLRRWVERGWVVESLETQVRGATVVTRSPRRLVIVVTDRFVGGFAVRTSGGEERRVALPRDRWSTRRITLRLIDDDWLVAGVRPA